MNTIPSTFNEKIKSYTAIGGRERNACNGISAIVLNRQNYPRRNFFHELEKTGFDYILSIEASSSHYDIEELSNQYPYVRFLIPENELNTGAQINLGAAEIDSPLFFVLRDDIKIIAGGTAKWMAERLTTDEKTEDNITIYKRLCTVPVIISSQFETLPTLRVPATQKKRMRTVPVLPKFEGQLSLYPFEGIGIYDRRRFIQSGGFDETLNNAYWQFLDFGFRAYLWGEEIALGFQLKVLSEDGINAENTAIDDSYRRFFLKNLAPVFHKDYAHLPYYRFAQFLFKSNYDLLTSWEEFSEGRRWVKMNRQKWRCDTRAVSGLWDNLPGVLF